MTTLTLIILRFIYQSLMLTIYILLSTIWAIKVLVLVVVSVSALRAASHLFLRCSTCTRIASVVTTTILASTCIFLYFLTQYLFKTSNNITEYPV